MAYRGDDLDLRTPQSTPGDFVISQPGEPFIASSRSRPTASSARSAPIWVDETLLDCCNHAYDIAAAHRAAEVRLEHLIYALTRIDVAEEALETRGVNAAALRREAAAVVATEIPAVQGNGKTDPRRTEGVEEVLRLAAAHAYRRQAPAGVSDVAYVLLESGLEFATLLRQLPAGARQAENALDVELLRERPRNRPAAPQSLRGHSADFAVSTQHSRIDAIEQSLRTLTTELANERKILSGVLQDLQRELMAQREDTPRLGGITHDKSQSVLGDRLQSLEQAFLSGRNGESGALHDRLGLLERALQAEISVTRAAIEALAEKPATDIGPLVSHIETIEAAGRNLSERVAALSATVERQPSEISALTSAPVIEHLNALAVTRDAQHAAATDGLAETHRRLAALEDTLNEQSAVRGKVEELVAAFADAAETSKASYTRLTESLSQDVGELHDGIGKVHSDHLALATSMEAGSEDVAAAFAALAGRIESLERTAVKPIEMLESLSSMVEKMHKVTVEKYYRRNRFWYWLFGTDDWLAASWPSQSARIAEELRTIKR